MMNTQDHLHSVIGELMHGLWSNVRSVAVGGEPAAANDTARTAARILGKLGGANRRPMLFYESQPLAYAPLAGLAADAELLAFAVDLPVTDSPTPLALNVDRVRASCRTYVYFYIHIYFHNYIYNNENSRSSPSAPLTSSTCALAAHRQRLHGAHTSGHFGTCERRAALPEPVAARAAAAAPPLSQGDLVRGACAARCHQQLLARHVRRAASLLPDAQVASRFVDALLRCICIRVYMYVLIVCSIAFVPLLFFLNSRNTNSKNTATNKSDWQL